MIVKQEDILSKVTAQYQPYIEAMRTPDLKSGKDADNKTHILLALTKACALANQISNDRMADKFIVEEFYKLARQRMPNARLGEITFAFQKGILRELGDFYGINAVTCFNWLKAYYELNERKQAIKEFHNLLDAPKFEKIERKNDDSLVFDAFEQFKKDGTLPFGVKASLLYMSICKIKGIDPDKKGQSLIMDSKIRMDIRIEAIETYKMELFKKNTSRKQIENLIEQCDIPDLNPSYKRVCRSIALRYYFEECIKLNKKPL